MRIGRLLRRDLRTSHAGEERKGTRVTEHACSPHQCLTLGVVTRRAATVGGDDGDHRLLGVPPEAGQALFVAIMSYNGGINFGLLADYDALDDVEVIAEGIESSIAELAQSAEAAENEREAQTAPA